MCWCAARKPIVPSKENAPGGGTRRGHPWVKPLGFGRGTFAKSAVSKSFRPILIRMHPLIRCDLLPRSPCSCARGRNGPCGMIGISAPLLVSKSGYHADAGSSSSGRLARALHRWHSTSSHPYPADTLADCRERLSGAAIALHLDRPRFRRRGWPHVSTSWRLSLLIDNSDFDRNTRTSRTGFNRALNYINQKASHERGSNLFEGASR